jgi:hypothetical protein
MSSIDSGHFEVSDGGQAGPEEAGLAEHIGKLVRAGPALFADDTPVKLQVRANTTKTKTARLWSYVRDERPSHQRCASSATVRGGTPLRLVSVQH